MIEEDALFNTNTTPYAKNLRDESDFIRRFNLYAEFSCSIMEMRKGPLGAAAQLATYPF